MLDVQDAAQPRKGTVVGKVIRACKCGCPGTFLSAADAIKFPEFEVVHAYLVDKKPGSEVGDTCPNCKTLRPEGEHFTARVL